MVQGLYWCWSADPAKMRDCCKLSRYCSPVMSVTMWSSDFFLHCILSSLYQQLGPKFTLFRSHLNSVCVRESGCACVYMLVCVRAYAGSCASLLVFVCLARIDMQTGLISRDLWALTGCRLVSTATTKGWRRFTYPDRALHPCAQLHVAHQSRQTWRCWEVLVWGWERERDQ